MLLQSKANKQKCVFHRTRNYKRSGRKDCCWHKWQFVQHLFIPGREMSCFCFKFHERSLLWYDLINPVGFFLCLFWGNKVFTFANMLFTVFSSCKLKGRSSTHHTDEEIIWQSAPWIRVIAWTPHCHFKILLNSIRRAALASWSGLIWQQGISFDCLGALSTCLCLSVVLISKSFVSLCCHR